MTSPTRKHPQQSVLNFKQSLKDKVALFAADPSILPELGYLRSVRRPKWNADLDYYGNRKHHSVYKAIREANASGAKLPRWNNHRSDTSAYPLEARIKIERESHSKHRMHAQLRRSIVRVLSYLIDKCDLISGVCVHVRKGRYRELYIREIAHHTGLGKRTVQRALANLTRHGFINRGVALIGITPAFYKALGLYSVARAMVGSLKALVQMSNYRGARINPEQIKPHKNFHRFNITSTARPSVRKLLASIALHVASTPATERPADKVPRWNSSQSSGHPPPATGPPDPPPAARPDPKPPSSVGLEALRMLTKRRK